MSKLDQYDALLMQHEEFDWRSIAGKKARFEAHEAFDRVYPRIHDVVNAGDLKELVGIVQSLR